MQHKILIVEDEISIRSFIKINFERNNYSVIEASSGEEAIEKALLEKPVIAVLDVKLPGISGFKVCEIIRRELPKTGIIMLTAKAQDSDKVMGLEHGADDYVVKPFNPVELVLRVRALLRRIDDSQFKKTDTIESPPFTLDLYSQRFYKNEKEVELTPKEFTLIKLFINNPGKAFTRDELLNIAWGYNYIGDSKIVDVNIRRLRTKIEDSTSPIYIETVWGIGYRWNNLNKRRSDHEKY